MCHKIVFSVILTLFVATASKIPGYIKVCKALDPRVTQCIATSIKDLLPKLKNGIRELDVPPIEPLHLKSIKLQNGVRSNITDLNVYGITTFKLTDLKTDVVNNRFMFKSIAPKLRFEGTYDLDMQMVFIPVKGRGRIRGTLTDGMMHGNKVVKHSGKEHLMFEKFQLKLQTADAKVQLDDLFGGNQFLGGITNSVINSNINVIMDDIMPALESSIAEELTIIANAIMDKFPYDDLLPRQ